MITCDFAILPVGTETTECKDYVTAAVQSIKDSGLNYQLTGMGTQIEADNLEELYDNLKSDNSVLNDSLKTLTDELKQQQKIMN